jgi:hypothetical protein
MSTQHRLTRQAKLTWVPLVKMQVSPIAQREFRQARSDHLLAIFDPEQMGIPTVNIRDDRSVWILEGQHRIDAYKRWLGDGNWEDQSIQCSTYTGMTEAEEAETFLKLNDTLTVSSFDKFTKGVVAGRPMEVDIDRIIRAHHLRISRQKHADSDYVGTIHAVTTLTRIYKRSGPEALGRTLRVCWNAYGQAGLESMILDGIGLLVGRHGNLRDNDLATKLQHKLGVDPLLTGAKKHQDERRVSKAAAIAASAVDIYNRRTPKRSEKLPAWWKRDETANEEVA